MKSFVINLASDRERMARMERLFSRCGLPFTRFNAVDRTAAGGSPVRARLPAKQERDWSNSELGCLLSHFALWTMIAANDEPFTAIFEDDVHIAQGLPALLNGPLPGGAAVIKIETVAQPVVIASRAVCSTPMSQLHRLVSFHAGSGAYIISRQAAQLLVDRVGLFDMPVDHILFEAHHPATRDLQRFQCVPALAIQDEVLPAAQREHPYLRSGMTDRPVFHGVRAPSLRERLTNAPLQLPLRIWQRAVHRITERRVVIPFAHPAVADSSLRPDL